MRLIVILIRADNYFIKIMAKLQRFIGISLLLLVSFTSVAQPKMGVPFFPPYAFFDVDGKLTGLWFEQLDPVFQRAGIEYKPVNVAISRFYSSIATGKVQLSALPKGMPGMENVIMSDAPFANFDLRVFWLDSTTSIESLNELAGKKVVLIKGYSYGGEVEAALPIAVREQFQVVDNQAVAIKKLVLKEADYAVGYWAMMSYLQKNFPSLQISNQKVAEIPIYFAVHKSSDNATDIMQKFNGALQSSN